MSIIQAYQGIRYTSPHSPRPAGHWQYMQWKLQDTGHADLEWDIAWVPMIDAKEIQVWCAGCNQQWAHVVSGHLLAQAYDPVGMLRLCIDYLVEQVRKTPCRNLSEIQLLAERITELLEAAGPKGLPYLEVIRSVVADLDAPGGDVARLIGELDFPVTDVDGRTYLQLPPGHICRTW